MNTIAVILIAGIAISSFFLGLIPFLGGGKGSINTEGRFAGFAWLVWTAFKVWAILKLGGWT